MTKKGQISTIQFVSMSGVFCMFSLIFSYEIITTVSVIIETVVSSIVIIFINKIFSELKFEQKFEQQKTTAISFNKIILFAFSAMFVLTAVIFFSRYTKFVLDFEPTGINGTIILIAVIALLSYANSLGLESKGRFSFVFVLAFAMFFAVMLITNINMFDITKLSNEINLNGRIAGSYLTVYFVYFFLKQNIEPSNKQTLISFVVLGGIFLISIAAYTELTLGKVENLGRFPYLDAFKIGGMSSLINIDAVVFSLLAFCGLVAVIFLFEAARSILKTIFNNEIFAEMIPLLLIISKILK